MEFTLTEDEYIAANRLWYRRYLFSRQGVKSAISVMGICGLVGAAGSLAQAETEPLLTGFGFFAVSLPFLLAMHGVCYLLVPMRARPLFRQHKEVQLAQLWRWSESSLTIVTGVSTSRYNWDDFHAWAEGTRFILLFVNQQLFYILPRRACSEEALREVREILMAAGPRRR